MSPKRHGGHPHFVLPLDGLERLERIALARPLPGELGAGDEVVGIGQYTVEAMVDGIDVDGHRNSNPARDPRRMFDSRRIVPVDVEQPRTGDLLRRYVSG